MAERRAVSGVIATPLWVIVPLFIVAWINLVSALVSFVGLTFFSGMGIPLEWIEGSVFTTYVWPGVILGVLAVLVLGAWPVPFLRRTSGIEDGPKGRARR